MPVQQSPPPHHDNGEIRPGYSSGRSSWAITVRRRRGRAGRAAAWLVLCTACGPAGDSVRESPAAAGDGAARATLPPDTSRVGLDMSDRSPFYRKHIDADGIPIISSQAVDDRALVAAREIVIGMLAMRPEVRDSMRARQARVGVMSRREVTTDMPEHAFLANDPDVDWNARARGLGGTPAVPLTTGAEENLLCLPSDRYRGESILVHEFAHGIHRLGIDFVDPSFSDRLERVYELAVAEGLWIDTYAATSPAEYWAEGVQSWFDANQAPQPGIHNDIDTRRELQRYDPRLAALIEEFFPGGAWRPKCPGP